MSDSRKTKSSSPRAKRASAKRISTRAQTEVLKPVKLARASAAAEQHDGGPRSWFLPDVETAYTRLAPETAPQTAPARSAPAGKAAALSFASTLQPGEGESVLANVAPAVWVNLLQEYQRRKATHRPPSAARAVTFGAAGAPPAPAVPGGVNWLPLGPTVVVHGQTVANEPIGGRVSGLAIAPGGQVIYAASANGGVFRSDNGGIAWRALMDGFDISPTSFASTCLACGAIAIDPAAPDRVYVGTGEGDTYQLFSRRVVNALPAYRGVGPIRSDDGGATWVTEASVPDLAGKAFFALAVDPGDGDHVVAATTAGLYERVAGSGSSFAYTRRREGVHSSAVVATADDVTRFFAAEWGVGVFHSADGQTWAPTGTGFPTRNVGRIALGVRADYPDRIYAFVASTRGTVLGLYRLDGVASAWTKVAGVPDVLPENNGQSQGDYDLAIAVSPVDPDEVIYLGGSYTDTDPFPGSVWRCTPQGAGSGFKVVDPAPIGTHAHADVHVLVPTPGDPDELWCGCDGGVFLNRDPRGSGEFAGVNQGLSCLCCNFIAQHPTDPSILFTGLQDNGTARTSGGPAWTHVNGGDGGYCVINWANPDLVLTFANGTVYRSSTGGTSETAWEKRWKFPWATMTQPIVSPPYDPQNPAAANLVAGAAGATIVLSDDFADSWTMQFSLPADAGSAFALAFATATRLFVGTTLGRVFRADRTGNDWAVTRLDNVAAGLGLAGLITDIAIDWSDVTGSSVYLTFGGMGDRRRVWHFDGSQWEARSGSTTGNNLLDVEHNTLIVDRGAPDNVYAGADIGVWHSPDQGLTWSPMANGLPDAPVFDLQVHPTQRLLRAATHGRGVYEIPLG